MQRKERSETLQHAEYGDYIKDQYDEVLRQVDAEHTQAVMKLSADIVAERERTAEARARAKSERKVLERASEKVERELAHKEAELGDAARGARRLDEAIEKMRRENKALRKELATEQSRTREWKQTATRHVHKGRELERLRQVLGARIRELELEAQPRERLVGELKAQVRRRSLPAVSSAYALR